jgi:hypothetical protein
MSKTRSISEGTDGPNRTQQPTNVSGKIEVLGDCAYYRPTGTLPLEEAVELLDQTIAHVRDRRIPKLLISARGLVGFRSPTLPERYFFVRRWAATARGLVQIALVVPAELIDPEKFGTTVAQNAGLDADVFTNEPEALAWLQRTPEK